MTFEKGYVNFARVPSTENLQIYSEVQISATKWLPGTQSPRAEGAKRRESRNLLEENLKC